MVRRIAIIALVFLLFTLGAFAQGGDRMAVTSAHYLATEAAMEVLREGGNAADAAFTTAAVLTIVEPWFSSVMGGGTWALYYDSADGSVRSMDGVGPAASGATPITSPCADRTANRGRNAASAGAAARGGWQGSSTIS